MTASSRPSTLKFSRAVPPTVRRLSGTAEPVYPDLDGVLDLSHPTMD